MTKAAEYARRYRERHPEGAAESRRRYRAKHPGSVEEQNARSYARKLMRGERIKSWSNHHKGMAKLKEWMGSPRPEGMTLSLVNPDGPAAYNGYDIRRGTRGPYRLSTSALDYEWESLADNCKRRSRAGEKE